MNFLTTPWLWGPLFALLPLVVVMYLLKLKRKRVVMPSTLLWRRSVQDLIANAPFQKLRNNLLLWLQLLILLLLIFAFARPVMKLANLSGTTLILLIDNSASMQTQEDAGKTRLDLAKEAALEAVDTLSARDECIVVAFSDQTRILQTLTSDRTAIRAAINSIKPREVSTSLSEAGMILQGLTTTMTDERVRIPREDTKTVVLSDGAIEDTVALADIPNVEFVSIGHTSNNLGITAVDVRETFTNTFEYQIFCSITNASEEEKDAFVELEMNGEILDLKGTRIAPNSTGGVVFTLGEELTGLATLTLDSKDNFPLDDVARVQIAPSTDISVLLVSKGNRFLERVLMIDPRVHLSRVPPTDYRTTDEYDLVIFDGSTVGEIPPGNFVFFHALPPGGDFTRNEQNPTIERPTVIDWSRVHPLTRFVNFEGLRIAESINYNAPKSSVMILQGLESDLITLYETETRNILVVGFDVLQSMWPLDVSYPIFISNMIEYFARSGRGKVKASYVSGETIPIFPELDATEAVVTTPDDEQIEFSFEGASTAYLSETARTGVYQVAFDVGSTQLLPVNLASEKESRIAPVPELEIGGQKIVGTEDVVKTNQEIWHWFVLAGLLILLLEWLIYCRRTFM
ncbi:BatA and WFA domain-containing protein [bacterium]|nr:BatA and WFA domain-containing protein [bacterium]